MILSNNLNIDKDEIKCLSLPVCTRSPFCSSDISTDLPFSSLTLDMDGKQPPPPPKKRHKY